jgi:hypothetical protein
MRKLLVVAASALLFAACKRSAEPAQQGGNATAQAADGSAAQAPAAKAEAPAAKGPMAYVTTVAVLKTEPVDASKIKDKAGKEVSNYVTLLYRGEQVKVLETKDDWVRARSSDEKKEGWLKRSNALEADGLKEATLLVPTEVFDRPDLLAANAKRKLDPGTFVLVVQERAPFSEVNYSGSQNVWVLSERLAKDPKDVAAARLIEKARYLARNNKKDEAIANLGIIKTVAAESPLVNILAAELGQPITTDAGAATPTPSPQPASGDANATDPLSPGSAANQ